MEKGKANKPSRLGPFELHHPIGKGGMGEVWEAHHVDQRVPVAIKILTAAHVRRPSYRRAFRNEVRAMARLHHPGIATILDHGEVTLEVEAQTSGRLLATSPYIAMELARLGTLSSTWKPVAWTLIRDMLLTLLDALAHAHARGVVHRDIKPSNVLMAQDSGGTPRPKLTDFGVAHASDPTEEPHETLKGGTPHYMAPEQIAGDWRDQGPWTDLYAVGCMAYWLCSSNPPFHRVAGAGPDVMHAHLLQRIPRLESAVPIPDAFQAWLDRMLAKDPTNRFQRAADAAYALTRLDEAQPERSTKRNRDRPIGALTLQPPSLGSSCTTVTHETASGKLNTLPSSQWIHFNPTQRAVAEEYRVNTLPTVPPIPKTWRHPEPRTDPIAMVGAGLTLHGLRAIPFVNRDVDRDEIWATLLKVGESGRAHVVVLHGLPGVGKSRLAEWISQRADEVGSAVVLRTHHGSSRGPTDGLVPMIERYLATAKLEHQEVLNRLLNLCERGFLGLPKPDLEPGVSVQIAMLANLIRPPEDAELSSRQPRHTREERYGIIIGLLERIAHYRPVILWLDDVHSGLDALTFTNHFLSRQKHRPAPILVLMTVRDDLLAERPLERALIDAITAHKQTQCREIGSLDPSNHSRLVQQVLRLEGELGVQVENRTAGNPLFAVQLIGDWVQRGTLDVGQTGFRLKKGERAPLPDDIHQLWSDRIDRLATSFGTDRADHVKHALEIAALLGQEFIPAEWDNACRCAKVAVPPGLVDALADQRLAKRAGLNYTLEHGMLRESLERSCRDAGRWCRFHLAAASMVERMYTAGCVGRVERLSHHFLESGQLENASTALLAASEERWAMGEYDHCYRLLARCQEVLTKLGVSKEDVRWADCCRIEATALTSQFRANDAEPVVQQLEQLANRNGDTTFQAHAQVLRGHMQLQQGHFVQSVKSYDNAITTLQTDFDTFVYGSALRNRAGALFLMGDHDDALLAYEEALEFARSHNDTRNIAWSLQGLGHLFSQLNDHVRGTEVLSEAKRLFEKLGSPDGLAWTLNGLGELARSSGDLDNAEKVYQQAFALLSDIDAQDRTIVRINLALVLLDRRDFGRARAILNEIITDTDGDSFYSTGVAWACLLPSLAFDDDWACWDDAIAKASESIQQTALVHVDLATNFQRAGEIALERGKTRRAKEALELAGKQWKALERTEALDKLEKSLARLDD